MISSDSCISQLASSGNSQNSTEEDDFRCPICLQYPLNTNLETPCCNNRFTKFRTPNCPICRGPVRLSQCGPNKPIQRLINNLIRPCPHGCPQSIAVGNFSDHSQVCELATVPCPHSTLCREILRSKIRDHTRFQCPFRPNVTEDEVAIATAMRMEERERLEEPVDLSVLATPRVIRTIVAMPLPQPRSSPTSPFSSTSPLPRSPPVISPSVSWNVSSSFSITPPRTTSGVHNSNSAPAMNRRPPLSQTKLNGDGSLQRSAPCTPLRRTIERKTNPQKEMSQMTRGVDRGGQKVNRESDLVDLCDDGQRNKEKKSPTSDPARDFWTRKRQKTQDSPTASPASRATHSNNVFRPAERVQLVTKEEHMRNLTTGRYGMGLAHTQEQNRNVKRERPQQAPSDRFSLDLALMEAGRQEDTKRQNDHGSRVKEEVKGERRDEERGMVRRDSGQGVPVKLTRLPELDFRKVQEISHRSFRVIAMNRRKELVHVEIKPSRNAELRELPDELSEEMKIAMKAQGFHKIFSHQLSARTAALTKDENRTSTALYLFPLNALAKDQEEKLIQFNRMIDVEKRLKIVSLSGGVPMEERVRLFSDRVPDILVTNPDLLHHFLAKLKNSQFKNWSAFLKKLRFVVLDEAHTYSGILGCHVSNLIRRLYNTVDHLGGESHSIQFLIATATVGNSLEMASKLISRKEGSDKMQLISESGSAQPERTILCLAAQDRTSRIAAEIIIEWIQLGLKGIVFCNSINAVNSLSMYIRESPKYSEYSDQVRSYYSSMSNSLKVKTLDQLKTGVLKVIISTNALEAGVDIDVDACLLRGYPGSRMSFLQRMGRAGRRGPGLVIFLPNRDNALDFYFAEHPEALLGDDIEKVTFNAEYPGVKGRHIWCASVESGLSRDKLFQLFGNESTEELVRCLEEKGSVWIDKRKLKPKNKGTVEYAGRGMPHREFSLRGGKFDSEIEAWYRQKNKVMEKMSEGQALARLFPGAIFVSHDDDGKMLRFDVESLDINSKKATLVISKQPMDVLVVPNKETTVKILQKWGEKVFKMGGLSSEAELHITYGWGHVVSVVYGCEKKINRSGDDGDSVRGEKRVYDQPFQTSYEAPCLRFSLNAAARTMLNQRMKTMLPKLKEQYQEELDIMDRLEKIDNTEAAFVSIHSLIHQLIMTVPLVLLSTNDIEEAQLDADKCQGYLTDSCDGGTGVCERIFNHFMEFVEKGEELSSQCPHCDSQMGCAICLYIQYCNERNDCLVQKMGVSSMNLFEHTEVEEIVSPHSGRVASVKMEQVKEERVKAERVKEERREVMEDVMPKLEDTSQL
ncbi:DEAD/DEAH box helicase [Planoprotostelium fungivorum]|uniref:DEAD/DEAH box helicase n=1 Tax=Planoprotostelium fungivorum TaxID=1890364 RepID=A0A2P6NEM5_9EUKA|nr:DEAD/DEAH box helicase [Planoprotostelium fungivorum]